MTKEKISIIIPVYNSTKSLNELVDKISRIRLKNYEIIFVDDQSKNSKTQKILSDLAKKYKSKVKVIFLSKNVGRTKSVLVGLKYASGYYNIIMDDDLQHDPEYIKIFLKYKEHDIVFANYARKKDILNNLFSYLKYLLDRLTFNNRVRISSFFMINSSVKKIILSSPYSDPYLPGLVDAATDDIVSFDIKLNERKYGSTGYNFAKKISILKNIFFNYSNLPFKILFYFGLIFLLISTLIGFRVMYNYIYFNPISGWTSMMGVIIFFGGINFLYTGFMGYVIFKKLNFILSHKSEIINIKKIINYKKL